MPERTAERVAWSGGMVSGLDATIRGGQLSRSESEFPRPNESFWGTSDWLFCRDGKWRPVERGTYPLAFRIPARMGLLRGYGNAICIPVAKAFIEAYLTECDSKLNP